jgi:XRE family transcriptional regulator, aerobic/anaerobic benzoate catabolism transcriptional regulator
MMLHFGMSSNTAISQAKASASEPAAAQREPFLLALGERVRAVRAKRGMTRKSLANESNVSERHLANLELGVGNVSILILHQIATTLQCDLAEIVGDITTRSPEWLLLRRQLTGLNESQLQQARTAIAEAFGLVPASDAKARRIALIGLRGAGKSSYGRALAARLQWPFVELSREIEVLAGCDVAEIHALYGVLAYTRYERSALEKAMKLYDQVVIATPGGIVADTENFDRLLSHCHTVWLQATPEEHMNRVLVQGDTRPIAASKQAMSDLQTILKARTEFYKKADFVFDTSQSPFEFGVSALADLIGKRLAVTS